MKRGTPRSDFPLSESTGAMVRMTHLAFAQDLQNHLANFDIPVGMWFYLRALWEEDGITQRELSKRVCATEPTTALQLVKMEERGYIERRRSEIDRRNSHVHLTARGRALQAKLLPYAVMVNASATAGLTAKEVAQLHSLLAKLRENLEARLGNDVEVEKPRESARRTARSGAKLKPVS